MKVLFAPETFNLGETSRGVEVAKALRDNGHDCRFVGYSTTYADYIREAGFPLEILHPELTDAQAAGLIAADQGRPWRHPFTEDLVRQRVASEMAVLENWRPAAVVIGSTLTQFISARAAGVPLVHVKPFALSKPHVENLAAHPFLPGRHVLGRVANGVAARAVPVLARRITWKPSSFTTVAEEVGYRLPSTTMECIEADLNLIASIFPTLDGRRMPEGYRAVGPIFARSSAPLDPVISGLANQGRPLIYLGLGSSANRDLVLKALHGLADLDITVVSSAGAYLEPGDRVPENVSMHRHLPADRLAGLIDASIIHGGEGTVQTACLSGKPFAGLGLQAEQRFNIAECVRYGNAVALKPQDLDAGRLGAAVTRLLGDKGLAERARHLQRLAEPLDGPRVAARAIEDFVRRPAPPLHRHPGQGPPRRPPLDVLPEG